MGSEGSVLKVKEGVGGGNLLCSQIKELEEGGLLFAQSEESQRAWGVAVSPGTVALQSDQRLSAALTERQREVIKDTECDGQSKDFIWTEVSLLSE